METETKMDRCDMAKMPYFMYKTDSDNILHLKVCEWCHRTFSASASFHSQYGQFPGLERE